MHTQTFSIRITWIHYYMKKKPRTPVWSNTPPSSTRRHALLNQSPNYKDQPISPFNLYSTLIHKQWNYGICKASHIRTRFWIMKDMFMMEFWSIGIKIDWLKQARRAGIVNIVIQMLSVEMAHSWMIVWLRRKLLPSRSGIPCSIRKITHWARMSPVWKT